MRKVNASASLADLEWHGSGSTRLLRLLRERGITTVGDVKLVTPRQVQRIPGFGRKSLNLLVEVLADHGHALRKEREPRNPFNL